MNVAGLLADASSAHARRPALLVGDESLSYGELELRVATVAKVLQEGGIGTGDRVALMLPNGVPFVAAYFAVLRLGAIAVPLNVLLREAEVTARLASATPRVLVVDAARKREMGSAARARGVDVLQFEDVEVAPTPGNALVERGEDAAAVLLFTSGTSGTAKGAVLTHGSLRAAALNAAFALALAPEDVVLGAAPFSHVLGQATGILSTFVAGAAIAVVPRFDAAETLSYMTSTRTTIVLGVPAMCIMLCEAARDAEHLPPVRIAHVGGAPVPLEVARDFEQTFGAQVREGYGLTEMSGIATTYGPDEEVRPGSVGRPRGATELRIVSLAGEPLRPNEVGEAQFRGPSVFAGYWLDEGATQAVLSADGWLSTGDMGYVDNDGYLFLVDRKNELINRGGYNVYPREVEEVFYAHPDVLEAAVVGIPHAVLGEEVAAAVVLQPGSALTTESLREFVRERVAAYKYPRHVVFVDALPKTPTGKILKRALDREELFGRASANQVA